MGTRHLIAAFHEGQFKLAKPGQFDGYPSNKGVKILRFLREEFDREAFIKGLNFLRLATDDVFDEAEKAYRKYAEECKRKGVDPENFEKKYPFLDWYSGTEILSMIQSLDRPKYAFRYIEFASDSLFCEWAYLIDLDENMFEVYKGFNKMPLGAKDRFYYLQRNQQVVDGERYYPVRMVAKFPLWNLPDEKVFLEEIEKGAEEPKIEIPLFAASEKRPGVGILAPRR